MKSGRAVRQLICLFVLAGILRFSANTRAQEVSDSLAVLAAPVPARVVISEFMADNDKTLHDEDGDSSDWIELFNAGEELVHLAGWFLTDNVEHLDKWQFPDVELAPGSYLIVFASEKNRVNPAGQLHSNFKLNAGGEFLALVSPERQVISAFAPKYPAQTTDVSYGRVQGALEALGYFVRPTPGAANSDSGSGFAGEVEFSQDGGSFTEPFALQLSSPSRAAVIRYSLDGNMPTNSSPIYANPIPVSDSVQVRARAFEEGRLPGPVRTEAFIRLNTNVVSYTSDLPIVVIHALGKGGPSESRQTFASFSVYEPFHGVASLTNPPSLTTRSGIKVRGSSTASFAKSSFAVEFWNEFNQAKDREILGLPKDSDWVLYAPNVFDPVLIHNPFIHQLSRDIGRYSPRTRFVEVYLNKSTGPISAAQYFGIYVLEEKIKVGPNRVAIDKLEPENSLPPAVTGGYILKIDRLDPGDSGFSAAGQRLAYVEPKEPEIEQPQRDPQEQYIKNYFAAFGRALNGANWLDRSAGYSAYIDSDAWVDFHILEVLSGNVDALVLSTYLYKSREGPIVFGPHWDFDRALGSTDGRDNNPRMWLTGQFFSGWWNRVCRDPDFWQRWIDRYQELRSSCLSRASMNDLIDRLANEVRQAQPRERKRWSVSLRGGSYQSEIDRMKNWLSNRTDFIDRQFVAPPRFEASSVRVAPGFALRLASAPPASIYYTLDGSDPRLPQGSVSPSATVFSTPIVIDKNVRVTMRARNLAQRQTGGPPISSPWSSVVAASFVVEPPPLLITELMFRPSAREDAGHAISPASDLEFIELKNAGSTRLSLIGYHFTNGIGFRFTGNSSVTSLEPGERLLLVKNQSAFKSAYPLARNVAGPFTGSLGDGTGRLTLLGPVEEVVFDLAFYESWQPLADGFGFSLVLTNENVRADAVTNAASWRLSSALGGSPGEVDPAPLAFPHVLVNEVLSNPANNHSDGFELFNPSEISAADVSGWYLTDDFRVPKKLRLPFGTIVPARAYLWIDTLAGIGGDFSFSKQGEQIYLFSADSAGNLTGWAHGFSFGAAEADVSFGRYVNSIGIESFVAQTALSPGAENPGPRVGPVVISEVFAGVTISQLPSYPEPYVELGNMSSNSVAFSDLANPANTWKLQGDVSFEFPSDVLLPPGGFLVVVGFDPARQPDALARFRSRYALDEATPLFGPWEGGLNPSALRLRLVKSGKEASQQSALNTKGSILVDAINLAPAIEEVASANQALLRRHLDRFGDDPENWMKAFATPGRSDRDGDGLPDSWETLHGLDPESAVGRDGAEGDPDEDGAGNLQEFRTGTLPLDGSSKLQLEVTVLEDGRISFAWHSVPGRSYTLEFKEAVNKGTWQVLQSQIALPGGSTSVTDRLSTGQRFYRLTTP